MTSNLENKLDRLPPYKRAMAQEALLKGDLALKGKFKDCRCYSPENMAKFTVPEHHVSRIDSQNIGFALAYLTCKDKRTGELKDLAIQFYHGVFQAPGINRLDSRPRFCLWDIRCERMTDGWSDGIGTLRRDGDQLSCENGVLDPTKTVVLPNLSRNSLGLYHILNMSMYRTS